ncbi:MAG: hypothetical protein EI684_05965 [Candidatus Viridilinea halotolerans]|uniref:Novel STAND NTPase 1 domain-containing protein n=1 Tax=Candidatus Viridilinea halotolerans TaxID=2491704 RepID=A0A426U4R8_9CHLR|nr:MAG: hypothetical protein EI684_05965 [Candidatus Viridilinea halotolerans]
MTTMTSSGQAPNPYVGPRAFVQGETLYGRDSEVRKLFNLLVAERIVLLCAPSGAGKTSLIQAALIPKLSERDFQVLPIIRVNAEPPRTEFNRYIFSTLQALEESRPVEEQLAPDALAGLSIDDYLTQRGLDESVVLIFDQFEELLTTDLANREVKREFFAQLGTALRQRGRWALIAMREDYLAALQPYVRPLPTQLGTIFRLDLLEVAAAQEAMQRPAQQAGVQFDDDVVERLISDLRQVRVQRLDGVVESQPGPYIEPVQLQVVCRRLWSWLEVGATAITMNDLGMVEDVDHALRQYYAEAVLDAAIASDVPERVIREWCERLISEQSFRGQVAQGSQSTDGLANSAIHALINAHLVRAAPRRGITWFELVHDRLITPIQSNNAAWREANLSPLQQQAHLWERQGRSEGLLLRGDALRQAEAWVEANAGLLTASERDFLTACQKLRKAAEEKRRRNQQVRWLAGGTTVGLLLVLILAAIAFSLYGQMRSHLALAEAAQVATARQLLLVDAQQILNHEPSRTLALLLAVPQTEHIEYQAPLLLHQAAQGAAIRTFNDRDHTSTVWSVAFSPDGTTALSASDDQALCLWDVATGESIRTFSGHTAAVYSVAFSPDGATALSASSDQTLRLWDVVTGESLHTFSGHTAAVYSVTFSPDGTMALSGSGDQTLRLWDVATGTSIRTFSGHSGIVWSVAFSPDGTMALSGSGDQTLRLWDIATGENIRTFSGHTGTVWSVAFSSDGSTALSGSEDRTLRLWKVATGARIRTLSGHTDAVLSVGFMAGGDFALSGSRDGSLKLWDVVTAQALATYKGHTDTVLSVALSADGGRALSGSADHTLRLWDVTRPRPIIFSNQNAAFAVAYSPDGATLLAGLANATLHLWDATTHSYIRAFRGHSGAVHSVVFSPDGTMALSGSRDQTLRLWNVATGEHIRTFHGHSDAVNVVAFSPDGRTALSGSGDQTLRLWDVATGESLRTFNGHTSWVRSVAFSPDGRTALSASGDQTVRLWDVATGENIHTFHGHSGAVYSVAFSPDGSMALSGSGDQTVRLWDVATGENIRTLRGHTATVWSVAFSPDGTMALSGSSDHTVWLWDVATGHPIQIFLVHTGAVNAVAFSPDGEYALSGSGDLTMCLSRIDLATDLLDWIRQNRYLPRLTEEERERYMLPAAP